LLADACHFAVVSMLTETENSSQVVVSTIAAADMTENWECKGHDSLSYQE